MKLIRRPVPMTILFGIFCGIVFIPLNLMLDEWLSRPHNACLALWLFAASYTLLLCFWSGQNLIAVLFPILYLLFTVFIVPSFAAFFFLALTGVGWIRSGICYREHGRSRIRLMIEMLLCGLGGLIPAVFNPTTVWGWILGIWLFFWLQALYFAVFEAATPPPQSEYEQEIDPFERAYRRAENIVSQFISHRHRRSLDQ